MKTERTCRKNTLTALTVVVSLILVVSVSAQSLEPTKKSVSSGLQWLIMGTLLPAGLGTALILKSSQGMNDNAGAIGLGVGIGTIGALLGPSLGQAYAQRPKPMKGFWLRFVGGTICGLGILGSSLSESFSNKTTTGAYAFMGLGGALYLYSAISDIATVPRSVKQYNERHGFSNIKLTPCYFAQHDAVGLTLAVGIS